jgi:hypothetical protein
VPVGEVLEGLLTDATHFAHVFGSGANQLDSARQSVRCGHACRPPSLEGRLAELASPPPSTTRGPRHEAHALFAPLYGWFTERFATEFVRAARMLLDELR